MAVTVTIYHINVIRFLTTGCLCIAKNDFCRSKMDENKATHIYVPTMEWLRDKLAFYLHSEKKWLRDCLGEFLGTAFLVVSSVIYIDDALSNSIFSRPWVMVQLLKQYLAVAKVANFSLSHLHLPWPSLLAYISAEILQVFEI